MSDKSPLFISSIELFAHAVELYGTERPRNFKFVILHLANAVELLLKDALIDLGESIYKNPKETISIWGAFDKFTELGIAIPEKPHLEILIDDRNTIQHRFGFPDARATYYYIEIICGFLSRFLKERYTLDYEEVIPEYLDESFLPLAGIGADGTKRRIKALLEVSPASAVIEAFNDLEHKMGAIISVDVSHNIKDEPIWPIGRRPDWTEIVLGIIKDGYLPNDAVEKFQLIRRLRNQAAHGVSVDEQKGAWSKAIEYYSELIRWLDRAIKEGYLYSGNGPLSDPGQEGGEDID